MDEIGNTEDLVRLKITHLIKFADSFAGVEIHLFISGKYVKLNYANEQFTDILRKLQQKEMEEVYVHQSDCKKVLDQIQLAMQPKSFYDPKTTDQERIETLEKSHEVAKSIITKLGVDKQTIEIMKTVNQKTMGMLAESPSIFAFIKNFKKNCSEEFMMALITGYLTSLVIEKFPWKSVQVKEKAALASLLCDITLKKEDFAYLKDHYLNGGDVPTHVRNHPSEVVSILSKKKELIPSETLTIIEQHHELPDGKGFPIGIEIGRFNQLSTIFIICQRFTEMLFAENFDYNKRREIITVLQQRYSGRNFDKAIGALISVVE
jgi:hypothetical protein